MTIYGQIFIVYVVRTGLIVHTDQGNQYASDDYCQLLAKHQLTASMSGKGNCDDHAVMERFFLNLKMERVWQTNYANHQEAIRDISHYIVAFYNAYRLQLNVGLSVAQSV